MTIKNQLAKLEKIALVVSILHLILGIYNIVIYYGILTGIGSLAGAFCSFKIYLCIRKILKDNDELKNQLHDILKYLKYYFISVIVILLGMVCTYFMYNNYINDFFDNIIY